jgi:lauroyl/myristoyl acyltransferase
VVTLTPISTFQPRNMSKQGQRNLTQLSGNSRQVILPCGHNMNLEAPEDVAKAIRQVVTAVRNHSKL